MRVAALCLAGLMGLLIAVVPALARDEAVTATPNNTFSPRSVTIKVGESVTWTNSGGFHNVHFEDGKFQQPEKPASQWSAEVKRTFTAAGSYEYLCDAHAQTMSGTVIVEPAETTPTAEPSSTATASPTSQPTTSPTASPTAGPTASPTAGPTASPTPDGGARFAFTARLAKGPFTAGGKRGGIRLVVDLDGTRARSLAIRLDRRTARGLLRRFGRVRLLVRPGRRTYRLQRTDEDRRIGRGRYRLEIDGGGRTFRFALTVR